MYRELNDWLKDKIYVFTRRIKGSFTISMQTNNNCYFITVITRTTNPGGDIKSPAIAELKLFNVTR